MRFNNALLAESTHPRSFGSSHSLGTWNVIRLTVLLLAALSLTTGIAQEPNHFDMNAWTQTYGKAVDLKEWSKSNPFPHLSYLNADRQEIADKWFIYLGPVGVRAYMHDTLWGEYKGIANRYPKALCDSHGVVFNNLEVIDVLKGSPGFGHLQVGDLILEVEDTPLLSATSLPNPIGFAGVRSLEVHAGRLQDVAEGRGRIKLTILRLPETLRKTRQEWPKRKWKTLQTVTVNEQKTTSVSVMLHGGMLGVVDFGKKILDLGKINIECDLSLSNGSRSMTINKIHGPFIVPPGTWKLSGTVKLNYTKKVSSITCTVKTIPAPQLLESLKAYRKTIEFDIPRMGSFGTLFDPNSPKVINTSRVMAHAIARQQKDDGSWGDVHAWTCPGFYSSMCGLALMSTGDPRYKQRIHKAAHYVAYHGIPDNWCFSRSTQLIFLAEYYLKTRDPYVVQGLKSLIGLNADCVLADYTAGHKQGSPGYATACGYIGGGSTIACALALAAEANLTTPAETLLLDRMLKRVQQLAPTGVIPYARTGFRPKQEYNSHGSGCTTGAYMVAALLRGGGKTFLDAAQRRYSAPYFGTAEAGHGTQTMHFFWSSIGILNCGDAAHIKNMSTYSWMFTGRRGYDGYARHNNTYVEYHGGDPCIGQPLWRTASFVILMNGHKRNLGITGNPKYISVPTREEPFVYFQDDVLKKYVLRNWDIVNYFLGDKAPAEFVSAQKKLNAVKGETLGPRFFEVLNHELPAVAKSIHALGWTDRRISEAKMLRMLHGVTFETHCELALTKPTDTSPESLKAHNERKTKLQKAFRARTLAETVPFSVSIIPYSLVLKRGWTVNLKKDPASFDALQTSGVITISDPTGKLLAKPVTHEFTTVHPTPEGRWWYDQLLNEIAKKYSVTTNPTAKSVLQVKFDYTLSGIPVSHVETITVPGPTNRTFANNFSTVTVRGKVLRDCAKPWSYPMQLEGGGIICCEPRKRQLYGKPVPYVLAGTLCEFTISPDTDWAYLIHSMRVLDTKHRLLDSDSVTITGLPGEQSLDCLTDTNDKTALVLPSVKKQKNLKLTVTHQFQTPVHTEALVLLMKNPTPRTIKASLTIETREKGVWTRVTKIGMSNEDPLCGFPAVTTKEIRVTIEMPNMDGLKITELQFVKALTQEQKLELMGKTNW